jgi:hypothetical protein
MKYYRLIILVKEGRLLFSDIDELFMDQETYETGNWEKPITKIVSPNGDFHFMAFVKDYLEAMIAGIAIVKELQLAGLREI